MDEIDPDEYTFTFGKYQFAPYFTVKATDPHYIQWCDDSLTWFTLPADERNNIDELCESVTKRYLTTR